MQLPDAVLPVRGADDLAIGCPPPAITASRSCFLPRGEGKRLICHRTVEGIVADEGQKVLGWRDVPVVSSAIGWLARSQEPVMEQLLIGRGRRDRRRRGVRAEALRDPPPRREVGELGEHRQRRAWASRSPVAARGRSSTRGCSSPTSSRPTSPTSADPTMESALALVHSRYSTNTFPQWGLAQPFHLLAHNGEINTLQGNVHWLKARESRMQSRGARRRPARRCCRCEFEGLSDSAVLDQVLALLVQSGRSLPHALHDAGARGLRGRAGIIDPARRAFYQYHSCLTEPWDGPASLVFTDGTLIGAMLDRNGLRPSRYVVTHDDLVVMASEVGVLPIPPEKVRIKGRLQPGKMFLRRHRRAAGSSATTRSRSRSAGPSPTASGSSSTSSASTTCPSRPASPRPTSATLLPRQQAFGYTQEDVTRDPPAHGPGRQGAGLEHGHRHPAGRPEPTGASSCPTTSSSSSPR